MTRWLYTLLMVLAQPFLRRKLVRRGRQEPGYLEAIEERFGHYSSPAREPKGMTVWIHAVSLGETRTAALLLAGLRESLPGMRLVFTHGTATGRAEGARWLQAGDAQSWQPWDTPGAVQGFLRHFKPDIGLLMETEIWPNLVAGCQQAGVPLGLVNARMSEKSQKQAQRLAWLSRPAFAALTAVYAQTALDAQRLLQLGARVRGVTGNLKFDARPQADQLRRGQAWRRGLGRPVALFASSREGEEAVLLDFLASFSPPALEGQAQAAINLIATGVQWLIVPRHPQRFDAVAALIENRGFKVSRRSAWADAPPDQSTSTAPVIWLGDSLGEMALYYGLADVALLGGSFEPLGGQNLIEAAACACPVVMGPHTFNFAEAAALALAAGAAVQVATLPEAVNTACQLLGDPSARTAMADAATAFSNAHRGAVEKTAAAIVSLLHQQRVNAL